MSVFPKQSSHALPVCYRHLMEESKSPIIDFYPIHFRLDVNGAAFAWMGVNLLPFIEGKRLQKAMDEADEGYKRLNAEEKFRNKRYGDVNVYFKKSETSPLMQAEHQPGKIHMADFNQKDPISGKVIGGDALKIGDKIVRSVRGEQFVAVENNQV